MTPGGAMGQAGAYARPPADARPVKAAVMTPGGTARGILADAGGSTG